VLFTLGVIGSVVTVFKVFNIVFCSICNLWFFLCFVFNILISVATSGDLCVLLWECTANGLWTRSADQQEGRLSDSTPSTDKAYSIYVHHWWISGEFITKFCEHPHQLVEGKFISRCPIWVLPFTATHMWFLHSAVLLAKRLFLEVTFLITPQRNKLIQSHLPSYQSRPVLAPNSLLYLNQLLVFFLSIELTKQSFNRFKNDMNYCFCHRLLSPFFIQVGWHMAWKCCIVQQECELFLYLSEQKFW